MLVFKDGKVIEGICKALITASKIGEHVNIVSSTGYLQFFTLNSSLTVVAETTISARLYEGDTRKNTHIKSRSAEVVARVILRDSALKMHWEFATTPTGGEVLEINVNYAAGVSKTFKLPLVHIVSSQVDFMGPAPGPAFSFACLAHKLSDAFSHCDLTADEIKLVFYKDKVNLHMRKIYRGAALPPGSRSSSADGAGITARAADRAKGFGADRDVRRSAASLNGGGTGLSTIVTLQPETFEQITMLTPLKIVFKFKEFRTMVRSLDMLSENVVVQVRFEPAIENNSTILEFSTVSPLVPPFQYRFRFRAKQSSDMHTQHRWLKVGKQYTEQDMSTSNLFIEEEDGEFQVEQPHNEMPSVSSFSSHSGITPQVQTPVFQTTPQVQTPQFQPASFENTPFQTPQLEIPPPQPSPPQQHRPMASSVQPVLSAINEPPPLSTEEDLMDIDEVGYTQGEPTSVKGIFD